MGLILVLAPMIISSILNQQALPAINNINTLIDKPTDFNHVYVKTEPVKDGSKCYVSENSVAALKKLEWKIKEEDFLGQKRYFYLTSKENPKIVSVSLNNSYIDELRNKIVVAENTAITYEAFLLNPDPFVMDNYVLGYLRSFNKNYTGDEKNGYSTALEWDIVAGALPPLPYISTVDAIQGCKDYFSKYVSAIDYDEGIHGDRSDSLDLNSLKFQDPVYPLGDIDLIHLFASLDGCYDRTNTYGLSITDIYPIALFPQYTHDLVSWAGDLQQAAGYVQDNKPNFNLSSDSFYKILNANGSGCSYSDIIADMDAVNIAGKFLTGPGRVSDAIGDYYPRIYSNGYRTSRFIDGVLTDKNKNWSGDRYHQFEQEVYDALGLKWDGSDWVTNDEYNSNNKVQESRFKLLHNKNTDVDVRKYVTRSFVNYVLTLC